MDYSKELVDSVNKYNDKLESIAQRILNLKIDFNEKDIEVRNLYELREKNVGYQQYKVQKRNEETS